MFSIIISEKGGAERREIFEKNEISVGRVQGNDLMLPKGNVSKRHARLLFRDGRFIVTDLKSTNGTYVNGRKIAQATLVREGDKIYVGDFVLRVELAEGAPMSAGGATVSASSGSSGSSGSSPSFAAVVADGAPAGSAAGAAPTPQRDGSIVSHYPLENDPDDASSVNALAKVPKAPRLPVPGPGYPVSSGEITGASHTPVVGPAPTQVPRPTPSHSPTPPLRSTVGNQAAPTAAPAAPSNDRPSGQGHRLGLSTLVDRVAEMIDLSAIEDGSPVDEALAQRIERAVREQARVLKDDGDLPGSVDADALVRDAQRELLALGPIGLLLADDDVTEVQVTRHDRVIAVRGTSTIAIDPGFSGEESLRRAIARLCRESGLPLGEGESIVERQLPHGVFMQALLPPAALFGHVLVLRKRRRTELSLEDLVRSGTVSRAMATFLHQCVAARANILVAGPLGSGTTALAHALAMAGAAEERIVVLQHMDEIIAFPPTTVCLALPNTSTEGARMVRAATRIHADRLVVDSFSGQVASELVEAIAEGTDGVLTAVHAPSLRHALERIVPDLAATRPGLTGEAAREWLAASFDLAVEVARLKDGRHRVLRVSEIAGVQAGTIVTRDIFSFIVERTAAGGAIEGTFAASGLVPRIAEDLAARGQAMDSSLFKRSGPPR